MDVRFFRHVRRLLFSATVTIFGALIATHVVADERDPQCNTPAYAADNPTTCLTVVPAGLAQYSSSPGGKPVYFQLINKAYPDNCMQASGNDGYARFDEKYCKSSGPTADPHHWWYFRSRTSDPHPEAPDGYYYDLVNFGTKHECDTDKDTKNTNTLSCDNDHKNTEHGIDVVLSEKYPGAIKLVSKWPGAPDKCLIQPFVVGGNDANSGYNDGGAPNVHTGTCDSAGTQYNNFYTLRYESIDASEVYYLPPESSGMATNPYGPPIIRTLTNFDTSITSFTQEVESSKSTTQTDSYATEIGIGASLTLGASVTESAEFMGASVSSTQSVSATFDVNSTFTSTTENSTTITLTDSTAVDMGPCQAKKLQIDQHLELLKQPYVIQGVTKAGTHLNYPGEYKTDSVNELASSVSAIEPEDMASSDINIDEYNACVSALVDKCADKRFYKENTSLCTGTQPDENGHTKLIRLMKGKTLQAIRNRHHNKTNKEDKTHVKHHRINVKKL